MSDEYTEQDRANEGCCWDYVRQLCPGSGCLCNCHATTEEILLSDRATLRRQYDEMVNDNARLSAAITRERQAFAALTLASTERIDALTAERDAATARAEAVSASLIRLRDELCSASEWGDTKTLSRAHVYLDEIIKAAAARG